MPASQPACPDRPDRSRRRSGRRTGLPFLAALLLAGVPLSADAFELTWPAACTDGTDCFVQNYVDHPGPGLDDFTCGPLTYPGHDGTDIRLPNLAALRAGVAVLAPADGRVLRVRDGMPDRSIRAADGSTDAAVAAIDGRDCGNGIVISHGDGYETQLCHLKQGSVRVHPGDTVRAGDPVAEIGLSGMTEFPHVHLGVTRNGEKLDPFTGAAISAACGAPAPAPLWADPHPYRPIALLGDGFVDAVPDAAAMRDQPVSRDRLPVDPSVFIYWVDLMGMRAGDRLSLAIVAPDGTGLVTDSAVLPSPKAQYFRYLGKRIRAPLPAGDYRATLSVARGSDAAAETILTHTRTVRVE